MLGRISFKTAAALLLALAGLSAPAAADPIGGGHTTLKLDTRLYKLLRTDGIEVGRVKPAKGRGRKVTLPISSGLLESTYGSGYLFYKGGIRLDSGRHRVVLRNLLLNTERDWLRGKVGGTKLLIARGEDRHARRDGFSRIAVALSLKLTKRAADLLNRRLGLRGIFRAGRPLGRAATEAAREQVTVSGGTIYMVIDQGFEAKLQSLGVEVGPLESTEVSASPPTFALPALVSFVAPDLSWGNLYSEQGFVLRRQGEPGAQALIRSLGLQIESDRITASITLDPSPPLERIFGTAPLAAVHLTPQVDPGTGSISAPAATATLAAEAAGPLNEAFATPGEPAFSPGEPFAAVSFSAQTQ